MKLSPIWDYYKETDDPKYAQCKLCKEKKSLGSNNPRERTLTNIKRHIQNQHPVQWKIAIFKREFEIFRYEILNY